MTTADEIRAALRGDRCATIAYADPCAPDRPLELEIFRPPSHTPESPVVLALPSMTRDAKSLRESWMPAALRHGLLIAAISFPKSSWAGRHSYGEGNVIDGAGTFQPAIRWSFGVPARVLGLLQDAGLTTRAKAFVWGHSAGGQFAHRMVACAPQGPFEAVGAANASLYTMPTLDTQYPYGLGGIGFTQADLARYLAYKLEVISGDLDRGRDRADTYDAAQAQGANRFVRSGIFVDRGHAVAAQLGVPCAWRLIVAPNIGHKGKYMAQFSALHWFGG